ncbi:glycosyltransferase, partial [Pseudomonas sp. FW215-L1]|uniref:glycosyltransferase family protein n=1 Tax=Pseudomonas sp. FW215-L1 TaxID=2070614 RepID=UPI0035309B61
MLSAYRSFKIFLNVNSVTSSPSMCARRIFEIAASGTAVVSTESAALRNFFTSE